MRTQIRDLYDSLVRSITPIIVGSVIAWLVGKNIDLDPEFAVALEIVIVGILSSLYYIVARLLEVFVSPKFGWLLGLAQEPHYGSTGRLDPSTTISVEPLIASEVQSEELTVTSYEIGKRQVLAEDLEPSERVSAELEALEAKVTDLEEFPYPEDGSPGPRTRAAMEIFSDPSLSLEEKKTRFKEMMETDRETLLRQQESPED